MDKYWYSPLKKKKFRSHVEVQRYLGMLEIAKGDEDLAFKYFKQPRLAQPLIENMEQDEEKTKAPEGGKTSKFSIRSINVSTKLNTTKSVISISASNASKAPTNQSIIIILNRHRLECITSERYETVERTTKRLREKLKLLIATQFQNKNKRIISPSQLQIYLYEIIMQVHGSILVHEHKYIKIEKNRVGRNNIRERVSSLTL